VSLISPLDDTTEGGRRPSVSVVIPVYNAASLLERGLAALAATQRVDWECIVVDDGSTDASSLVATRWGARVLHTVCSRSGPAVARNLGARAATAPLLCFIDADVVVRPDTLTQFADLFASDPHLVAAFGSYDANPESPGIVSQYRNLLHHYVHQTARSDASTFWAGCGVIRRASFLALEGFDTRYTRPSIEDIELGYRVRAAGGCIRLAKYIQVTHLKRWTFWAMIKTDICDRALPWTALIARTGNMPDDLNVDLASRFSALCALALVILLPAGCARRRAWLLSAIPVAILAACNRGLYAFFLDQRGVRFLCCAVLLHWLYLVTAATTFVLGTARARLWRRF
jgi:glycosyltransferase involved in cell wall biosynthesis